MRVSSAAVYVTEWLGGQESFRAILGNKMSFNWLPLNYFQTILALLLFSINHDRDFGQGIRSFKGVTSTCVLRHMESLGLRDQRSSKRSCARCDNESQQLRAETSKRRRRQQLLRQLSKRDASFLHWQLNSRLSQRKHASASCNAKNQFSLVRFMDADERTLGQTKHNNRIRNLLFPDSWFKRVQNNS
jgi:hypothetical protein